MMRKHYFLLFSICAATLFSCENQSSRKQLKPVLIDAASLRSIKDSAKTHLINLITSIKINGGDNKDFNYTVKYQSGGYHQWARIFQMQNDSFKCIVSMPTDKGSTLKFGDTVLLSQDQVEDWTVENKSRGNKFGDYTQEYIKAKQ